MEDKLFFRRVQIIGMILALLGSLTVARLFYLQVFRHSHYQLLADTGQLRKFEVQPDRGNIYLSDRGDKVPVVMNRTLKRVYADPRFVVNAEETAQQLTTILKLNQQTVSEKLTASESFYSVIAEKVEPAVAARVAELDLAGIGIQDQPTRAYPEEELAAQVLGFVNQEGQGQYGVEESYNEQLSGQLGLLDATTDTRGIPIATSDNYRIPPRAGSDLVLTIDRNIQTKVEELTNGVRQKYSAKAASAVVMDPKSGAILAMVNSPTFKPAEYGQTEDFNIFVNRVTTNLYEPGSVIKAFTVAAGLETGAIRPETTYQDSGSVRVADREIKNARGIPTGTHTMTEALTKSINTGMVFILSQLGGGSINPVGQTKFHQTLVDKFNFGQATGIDLPAEAEGSIPEPDASPVDYANMSFGQGMSSTMLQVAAGYTAIANGGTLYKPYVVDQVIDPQGKTEKAQPQAAAINLLSQQTISELKAMLEGVVVEAGDAVIKGYRFGGKSGTAQIPNPQGGYYEDRDIGSFVGMAPLDNPQFVVMVRVDEPRISTFASAAARPVAAEIMKWLLIYRGIPPS